MLKRYVAYIGVFVHLEAQFLMAYSHCTGTGQGHVQGTGPGVVSANILYINVITSLRHGKEPGSSVCYCACHIPCTCTSPLPMQCKSLNTCISPEL